jgi:dTDP-4-amino-4,6-dideoxygalactose transaminase
MALLDLPGADAWYARALSLPLFVDMQDDDVDQRRRSRCTASARDR